MAAVAGVPQVAGAAPAGHAHASCDTGGNTTVTWNDMPGGTITVFFTWSNQRGDTLPVMHEFQITDMRAGERSFSTPALADRTAIKFVQDFMLIKKAKADCK
jgi:hypothetical protein